eukprot:TRINITY_DN26915_c0_g1_i1.p1 TRINITY_DN26915_c0_g1~~TRINITY_DN26915_c0_g1_i1.p1  ORF type:complete len:1034 (-),score=207.37 TRINITY_DN26915_c0_g1_i1:27-2711(-)
MAKYHFAWYKQGTSEMDVEQVNDAAELMTLSIQFSQCDQRQLSLEAFMQRMCHARWPYAVLLYSELGREFASRYLTEQAADILEKAVATFDAMKQLPYYAPLSSWQGPYDINFNEEWFAGAAARGPVWDKASVPLAQLLEANFETIRSELGALVDRGLFDELSFEGSRVEGQDSWPEGGWRAVQLAASAVQPDSSHWSTRACREAPRTCELLAARPELHGCAHAGAAFVRLRAGGRLKPQFGPAPKLQCHLALRADPGARMSVGNQTLAWETGEAMVIDSTFIRQEWHNGVRGENYVLQVTFCHPCEESQRFLYGPSLHCPAARSATPAATAASIPVAQAPATDLSGMLGAQVQQDALPVPFAQAALWAAEQPDLALCASVNEQCPPDSQHGGPNPLSALNTWNYALNNLKAALRHAGTDVDPSILNAIMQIQAAIQNFLSAPALEQFAPIVSSAVQIFEALAPWLRQQSPSLLRLPAPMGVLPVPADGRPPGTLAFRLSNGQEMPAIGFGTWKLEGDTCYRAVRAALELGIRHIDTAEAYGNEADIGRALRDSGVPREQLFIATKATSVPLGMADVSYLEAVFAGQLQALQTEYIDVYMLHAAGTRGERLQEVWRGMERLVELGRVRSLGVSNFGVPELEELWGFAKIKPVYLQNIFKVYKQGEQILGDSPVGVADWARSRGMMMVGYSTINSWPHLLPPLQDPHVLAIAKAHGRTASQVLHRWALQHGIAVIPKASSAERIRENAQLLDFELSNAEVAALDGLATLSESTNDRLRPAWQEDVYGLQGTAAAMGKGAAMPTASAGLTPSGASASSFTPMLQNAQCKREPEEVKAARFTLGGGGHTLEACQAGCTAQEDCGFVVFYQSTGFCHMFRSCAEQTQAGDGALLLARS